MTIHWIDAAILAAVWVWWLSAQMMRSIRSVLLLGVMAVAYLMIPEAPLAVAALGRGAVVAIAVGVLLVRPRTFIAMSGPDRRFDAVISQGIQHAALAARRAADGAIRNDELLASLRHVERQVSDLSPPNAAWGALGDRLAGFLRKQRGLLARVAEGVAPTDEELDAQHSEAKELVAEHHALRRRSRAFWG